MSRLARLLYPVYLLAFLAGVLFVFWSSYVDDLASRPVVAGGPLDFDEPPRHMEPDVMRRLGAVATARESSFANFELAKPEGVQRVCALGDSFTYGDEVAQDEDFPTRLGRTFRAAGWPHVEVLNFGNSWWGFHQTYLMWEEVATKFACDAVVLGPMTFFAGRDTRFNHTNRISPYYLHARFALAGSGVELLEPIGRSHEERFRSYFAFRPRWQYLRYDREAPAALQAVVGRNAKLANPFYYSSLSEREEAFATYRVLLRRMADASRQVLLFNSEPEVLEMATALAHPRLAVAESFPFPWAGQDQALVFPHSASKGHYSVWGNQVLAEQLFAYLTGAENPELEVIGFDDHVVGPRGARLESLAAVEDIRLVLGDSYSGALRTTHRRYRKRGVEPDLRELGARSLLLVQGEGEDRVNAASLLTTAPLSDGAVVRLIANGRDEELGVVRRPEPGLPVAVLATDRLAFTLRKALTWTRDADRAMGSARIEIEGQTVLETDDEGELVPTLGLLLHAVAHDVGARPEAIPESGVAELELVAPHGAVRIGLGRWTVRKAPAPPLLRPVAFPLTRDAVGRSGPGG